jgi:hypothetical protein
VSEHAFGLRAARARVAQLPLPSPACLEQLRTKIVTLRGVRIEVIDELLGHGIWLKSDHQMIVFTSPDPDRQLHDIAHLVLDHQPVPGADTGLVHGRATAGALGSFTADQEHQAEVMRQALAERLSA